MFTQKIIKKIKKAGLIGRGCNNFSTADKWELVRKAKAKDEKFVICNVSESEPDVFKDRYILENYPEKVVDGIKIAMKTIKAKKGFIYLNPEYYEQFYDYIMPIVEAEKINNEANDKEIEIATLYERANSTEFKDNQTTVNTLLKSIGGQSTDNNYIMAEMLNDESVTLFNDASDARQQAVATNNFKQKKDLLDEAAKLEKEAIEKHFPNRIQGLLDLERSKLGFPA